MNVAEKYKELFNEELTKESVDRVSILPIKKVDGLFRDITNWKLHYKIDSQLEDRAMTCIYLKGFGLFKEK